MATSVVTCYPDNSTLTNFKTWAMAISSAFATFGWIQASDTGQVNWSTIAALPSSTYVYEIWRMNDGLQASSPVFLKIGYGFSSTQYGLSISLGTGTTGTGSLVNPTTVNTDTRANNGVGTTYPVVLSGDVNRFQMILWRGFLYAYVLTIERGKDANGNDIGDYTSCYFGGGSGASTRWLQCLDKSGSFVQFLSLVSVVVATTVSAGLFRGNVPVLPCYPNVYGQLPYPMLNALTGFVNDWTDGDIITLNWYGANRTYMVLKTGSGLYFSGGGSNNAVGILRYE